MAALDKLPQLQDRSLLVIGAGMLGLTTCAIAAERRAAEIVCVEPLPQRRQLALQFGATMVLQPCELNDWCRGHAPHGFDGAIEMSGATSAFDSAWQAVRIGGSLILVGAVFPSPQVPIAIEQIVRRCLNIHGVHNYGPQHLQQAVEFLSRSHDQFPFEGLVTQWFPLHEAWQALEAAAQPGVVRIGVLCHD
jgi:alcohol dehydrogenase